ncbi:hypothetical protein BJY16_006608 [Actinoplanes octamycinicus]|uniref:Uncharacterized protein n=1 Tax=Actinoplanes octamycinicus TaxID=135948 RepID=A0A7W7MAK2_9ACTN|nr:hypothetical protein [Actinoplanes octamycinicus]MBB4743149.1 hypothetical protein [Actinoplanes octamycinicus]GIE61289.1 hypothetical protein Aoc01nite_66910 [Actinoplanes octamycinicus]
MDAILGSLTEAELALVREADPARLAKLDEDALIDLHDRVRRARNKQVKNYRRRAASRVEETGGRGKAYARNTRRRAKAEVFEELLSTVSTRLAVLALESAEALRAERLAEEAKNRANRPAPPAPKAKKLTAQREDRRPDSPDRRKRHASTRATGARRQARRDSR